MTQKDNILQELIDLESKLAAISRDNIFWMPAGYFDGLATEIINRIRALEAMTGIEELGSLAGLSKQNPYAIPPGYFDSLPDSILKAIRRKSEPVSAADELAALSPLLSSLSKQTLYSTPTGYFENLDKKAEQTVATDTDQSATEELESLSPLLNGLKKQRTYTAPEKYFEKLESGVIKESSVNKAKVVSLSSRKWFPYAAAAMIIGFVATIGFVALNKPATIDPADKSFAWVQKNLNKVSTEDINKFVELANPETPDMAKADAKDEINNLLKDVSDKDIQDFLKDAQLAESDSDDDQILN